jgi:hypothetical protein
MTPLGQPASVLAIYPFHRGLAYTLFETPLSPLDWGVKRIRGERGKEKNAYLFEAAQRLIDLHQPEVLVLEDSADPSSRRSQRSHRLQTLIVGCAQARAIDLRMLSKKDIRECFRRLGAVSRYEIAQVIGARVHAFERHVPTVRRLWMPEDERIGLFGAASLAMTYYHKYGQGISQEG